MVCSEDEYEEVGVIDRIIAGWDWEEKAMEELNEDPKTRDQLLDEFRSMVKKLSSEDFVPNLQDDYLMMFLRTKKFDLERALQCYQRFYSLRKLDPKVFYPLNKGMKDYRLVFDLGIATLLCKRNPLDGTLVALWRTYRWKPGCGVDSMGVFTPTSLAALEFLRHPSVQTYGVRFIIDLAGMSPLYIRHFSLNYFRGAAMTLQNGFPARFRGIHFVHNRTYHSIFFNVLKPLLKKKIADRIHLHGNNYQEMMTFIDSSIVPKEYGGEEEVAISSEDLLREFLSRDQKILAESRCGYQIRSPES